MGPYNITRVHANGTVTIALAPGVIEGFHPTCKVPLLIPIYHFTVNTRTARLHLLDKVNLERQSVVSVLQVRGNYVCLIEETMLIRIQRTE
jgi:hypothetical protein